MIESLGHSPLGLFIVQAVLIIALARLLGLVARAIGQPMVVAEVVAGVVLGPSVLGLLFPETFAALFPPKSLQPLELLSHVGLILFMFLIGLELDPRLLRGKGRLSFVIGLSGIVFPMVLGGLGTFYLHPRYAPPEVSVFSLALFMAAAMSVTAFPVLARILAERRWLRSRVGLLTITCAAFNDVAAWCVLAFVVSIAQAGDALGAAETTSLALFYSALMWWVVRPFLGRMARRAGTREGLTQNLVAVLLVLLFLSSLLTELIGIHALFGAFMLGVIVPREGGFVQTLAEKLEDITVVLLLPLFFAYTGLRTQLGLLSSSDHWLDCLLIVTIACVGKFGGTALAARIGGLTWKESSALGVLMNTRGLMELIILNIGLDLGIISPTLFAMMVVMALVTTFMTSPLLMAIYPTEALRKAWLESADDGGAPQPTLPPVGTVWPVLTCIAYERSGPGLVRVAHALLGEVAEDHRLYLLRLVRPSERTSFYMQDRLDELAAEGLSLALEEAKRIARPVSPLAFLSNDPGHDICHVAGIKGVKLILLGWHKPLLSQTVLGGTVHAVMTEARTDVAVFIERGKLTFARVLVPYYGSSHDLLALMLARRLSKLRGAEVTLLHVVSPTRGEEEPRLGVREQMDSVFAGTDARSGQVTLKVVPHQNPAVAAIEESRGGYDLVIVGMGAEWGLEHRQIGLRPDAIVQECPTSLLLVRRYERPS